MSISRRLTALLLAFSAAVVIAVGASAFVLGSRALSDAAASGLTAIAMAEQAEIQKWFLDHEVDVVALAATSAVQEAVATLAAAPPGSIAFRSARSRAAEELNARLSIEGEFLGFSILNPGTGEIIVSTDGSEVGEFRRDLPYFIVGSVLPHVHGPYYSFRGGRPVVTAAAPVRARDGRLVGVLAGHLNMDSLEQTTRRWSDPRTTDDAYLVNTDNLFVTRPRFLTGPTALRKGTHTQDVRTCLSGKSGTATHKDYRGVPVYAAFRWMPERGLCLTVKVDRAEVLAPTRALLGRTAGAGLVALLVAAVIAGAASRQITHPLQRLREAAEKYRHGDLSARTGVSSPDEVGQVAAAFDNMAETIAQHVAELRERGQQLAEANRELDSFAYSVAHELRAPLRALDGLSAILLRKYEQELPQETQGYLDMIRDNAQQQNRLIASLLHFSRTFRQELNVRPVSPAELARRAYDTLVAERDGRVVRFEVSDLPVCKADMSLLQQVFANLLANALKFTRRQDEARIEVGWKPDAASGRPVYFVRDNGVGFDTRYADRLFGVFQRMHPAAEFEGTGIGLAIVRRIIHRHGGQIWAESEAGSGATFYFTLTPPAPDRNPGAVA